MKPRPALSRRTGFSTVYQHNATASHKFKVLIPDATSRITKFFTI